MLEAPSSEVWAQLRARRPAYDEALEIVPATLSVAGSMYGMDRRGDLHLLLPVDGPPSGAMLPDLRGIRVRHRHLQQLGNYLDLIAAAPHQAMFSPLCAEVLNAVASHERHPWDAVFSTLRAWHAAWKSSLAAMDKTAQVGLFGELLMLEHIMIPAIGTRAVRHWSGPDAERHDFVGADLHLEVKTTRRSRHEHEISRFDQLTVPSGRRLFLASLTVESSAAGTETLANKIDAIANLVRSDASASDDFQAKLVQVGWCEEMRRTGELVRFGADFDSMIFSVDGQFPRLPDELILPRGIVALRYTIDLANLPYLDRDEVLAAVREGFPETY